MILRTLIYGVDVPGYASLMVVVLFLGGIQLITFGLIVEVVMRIYYEAQNKPTYRVRELFEGERKQTPVE